MKLIAQHPYVKIEREVTRIAQRQIEHARTIYLYEQQVVTEHRVFPIEAVTDFSFKPVAKLGGMLYLHTLAGTYMYQVKEEPHAFIAAYRAHFR